MPARQRRHQGGVDRLPSGRYRVRVVDPATGLRVSVGTFDRKAEAESAFAAALTDQGKGAWVNPAAARLTLESYSRPWVASRLTRSGAPLRPRVRELYTDQLRLHILPSLGALELGQIRPARVRGWYADLLANGVGQSTAAKCYRLLRAILNTARQDGLIAANPCTIEGGGVERAPERPTLTPAQVAALIEAIEPRLTAAVLLAAYCGLRRGEILALRQNDIDLLHGQLRIHSQHQQLKDGTLVVGDPKSDAGRRRVVLPKALVPVLDAHIRQWAAPGKDGLLFVGVKGGPLRPHVFQKQWDMARRAAGLPEVHFHDLRHFSGTAAASTGASLRQLMAFLGHATPRAALIYQHATEEGATAIADAMSALIVATEQPPEAPVVTLPTKS
jgi:integrase